MVVIDMLVLHCQILSICIFIEGKDNIISYISCFCSALVEAKQKYAEWRVAQENKAEQDLQKMSKKPAPYKHIKVRQLVEIKNSCYHMILYVSFERYCNKFGKLDKFGSNILKYYLWHINP